MFRFEERTSASTFASSDFGERRPGTVPFSRYNLKRTAVMRNRSGTRTSPVAQNMSSGVATPADGVEPRRMVFLAACLAIFMVSVEATIVATAIPTIVGDLGGLRLFSWVFGIYFLTQAVTIPIYGRLADLFGRRNLLMLAIVLFLAGSILSGFAHNMIALIVFRGLQGLGAGGVQPLATTIVGDLYVGGEERARVQGILSSVWGISAVTGPLLGAFLLQHAGWPTIFWVNIPFGILCMWLVLRFFDERVERHAHRIDYAGSFLLAAGIGTLMFALVMAGTLSGALTAWLVIIAVALIAALIRHELRTAEPMMPLRLFRIRVIGVANAGYFVTGALAMGITAFLPTYVQGAMGHSAILAGATLGVMSLSWSIGTILASRLIGLTYRVIGVAGSVLLVAGSGFLIAMQPGASVWIAIIGSAIIGFGFGFLYIVFVVMTQAAVGWEQRGAVTASILFMRQLGQAIGTVAFGAVFNLGLYARIPNANDIVKNMMEPALRAQIPAVDVTRYAAAIGGSLHGIYIILALLGAVTLVLTLLLPRNIRAEDTSVPA